MELAFQTETDELKKEYEEEQALLRAEQLLLKEELDRETAATKV